MNVDKALANFCISSEMQRGGDTGRRRVYWEVLING